MIVMSSVIVSRLTGFFREMLIPNKLGFKEVGNAYTIAFLVPDLMYSLLVGGAIAAALIPILSGYIAKDKEEDGWKAVSTFINLSTIVMVFACIFGMIYTPQLVKIVAAGFGHDRILEFELTVKLTRILFPSVAFLMLAGQCNGILNSYHRFAAAAYGPSIYNIGSALSILFLSNWGVSYVAYGVLASSMIYFLFQLAFAIKNLKYYKFELFLRHPAFKQLISLAIPSLIASSIIQINVIVSQSFTTYLDVGSSAMFRAADRIWQMPLGIFAQGIGIAMLPSLAGKFANGQIDEYKSMLSRGLKTVLLLSIPSAIGIVVLSQPIIRTVIKFSNKVDENSVKIVSGVLMFFSIALIAQSIVAIMNRAFYAFNDTRTPLFIGTITLVANYIFNKIFLENTNLSVSGMALSYSIAALINATLLLSFMNKKADGMYLGKLLVFMMKTICAALVMGIFLYFFDKYLVVDLVSKIKQIAYLSIEVFLGGVIYFVLVTFLKIEEALYINKTIMEKVNKILRKFK